jgi:taurine dioxygenase
MARLQVRDLTPVIGAEISGLDLAQRLDEATCRMLRQTFDAKGAVLFRDVDIDRTCQMYLTQLLMGQDPPPDEEIAKAASLQDGFWISNKEPDAAAPFGRLLFHCDGIWSKDPFEVLSLYGVEIQPPVIPTNFASSANAWKTLPAKLRAKIEGKRVVHVTGPEYLPERRRAEVQDELIQPQRSHAPSYATPIAHRHPRTGQTLLFVTQGMTREIVGLSPDESEDLLEELFAHVYRPDNLWEHEWRNGDLLYWDNLSLQHARQNVLTSGPVRTLRKVGLPVVVSDIAMQQVQSYKSVNA